ncbi:hypothetical protein [Halosegnis marinus]|uniref:hypothetical protein n=1 Tax=Halosegnis marinus TaxID=3034023 RepID=UPI003620F637
MTDDVRVERDGAVGRIVLDRPDANNAMDADTAEGCARPPPSWPTTTPAGVWSSRASARCSTRART